MVVGEEREADERAIEERGRGNAGHDEHEVELAEEEGALEARGEARA